MREQPVGRMPALTGWLLVGQFDVAGCQSTSAPKSLSSDASPAPLEIGWRNSSAPSAAMSQNVWSDPPKPSDPVRPTVFQEPPKKDNWMPPLPEIMQKDEPHVAVVAPAPSRFSVKHHPKEPLPLPNAPSEMNPIGLPAYIIRPADVLNIELLPRFTREKETLKSEKIGLNQPIYGPHPVHPDGTIAAGIYGNLRIAGKTVVEASEEIGRAIYARLNPESLKLKDVVDNLRVDIANYNNGFYYVIINYAGAAGIGEVVERFPVTGTETVLDAISKTKSYGQPNLPGIPGMTSPCKIWVARANPGHLGPDSILPVDWKGITQLGATNTNWQIMPGDRIYLQSEAIRQLRQQPGQVPLAVAERVLSVAQQFNVLRGSNSTNLVAPPPP